VTCKFGLNNGLPGCPLWANSGHPAGVVTSPIAC
jgi:hypothetical protein